MNDTVVGALIAASAGLVAGWAGHRWSLWERSIERQEARRVAFLTQRAADLRELADTLTEMVPAAKEIIWERVATGKTMPRSDPRGMRLTHLIHRAAFLRAVTGNEELDTLAGRVSSAADRLSDSSSEKMNSDIESANRALVPAQEKVASLLGEVNVALLGTMGRSPWQRLRPDWTVWRKPRADGGKGRPSGKQER